MTNRKLLSGVVTKWTCFDIRGGFFVILVGISILGIAWLFALEDAKNCVNTFEPNDDSINWNLICENIEISQLLVAFAGLISIMIVFVGVLLAASTFF